MKIKIIVKNEDEEVIFTSITHTIDDTIAKLGVLERSLNKKEITIPADD